MNNITLGQDFKTFTDGYDGLGNTTNYFQVEPWYPIVEKYYPTYYTYWQDSKIEKAFKIVQVLLDKKTIKVEKVKDFIELVNEISKVL